MEIASEIVQAQVSLSPMSAGEIASSLRQVFGTLHELEKAETAGIDIESTHPAAEEAAATKLSPADSIQNDKVICLECGAEMRQLTQKHLVVHGMNQKEYRKKYGFTMATPLAARTLTKARSKAAKKRGLPENLQKYIEARRQRKAKAKTPSESSGPAAQRAKRVKRLFSPKK
ncbi:MAG: MucR family transcriptional regulator [Syntrophobacteraceae bacterium]